MRYTLTHTKGQKIRSDKCKESKKQDKELSVFVVKNNFIEQMGSKLSLKNGWAFDRQKEKGCHSKCQ